MISKELADIGAFYVEDEENTPSDIETSPLQEGLQTASDFAVGAGEGTGFGSVIAGAGRAAGEAVSSLLPDSEEDAFLKAQGFDIQDKQGLLDEYYRGKDQWRDIAAEASENSPIASTAGMVGGAIGTGMALPAMPVATGGLASRVGQQVALGAGLGSVGALGAGEAKLLEGDVSGTLEEAAQGALLGGAVGGAFPLAGAAASKAADLGMEGVSKVSKLGPIEDLIELFKQKRAGLDLTEKSSREPLYQELNQLGEKIITPVEENLGRIKSQYDELEKTARFDLSDSMPQIQENIEKSVADTEKAMRVKDTMLAGVKKSGKESVVKEMQKIENSLAKAKSSKDQIKILDKEMNGITSKLKKSSYTPEEREELLLAYNQLKTQKDTMPRLVGPDIEDLGRLEELKKQQFQDLTPTSMRQLKEQFTPSTEDINKFGNLANESIKVRDEISRLMKQNPELSAADAAYAANKNVLTAMDFDLKDFNIDKQKALESFGTKILASGKESGSKRGIDTLNRVLESFKEVSPDKAKQFEDAANEARKKVDLFKKFSGAELDVGKPVSVLSKGAGKIATTAATATKWIEDSNKVQRIQQLAKPMFRGMEETIDNLSNPDKRAASLFSLSQMPGFRELLKSENVNEESVK